MSPPRRAKVPDDLALLYEFVNSLDERRFVHDGVQHAGGDALATVAQLEHWMRQRGLLEKGDRIDPKVHRKAIELREGLRGFLRLTPAERGDAQVVGRVNEVAADFPAIVQIDANGVVGLRPSSGGRAGRLGSILSELQRGSATGRLDRLKMCAAEDCRWVFYDRSKPASRRWCASALCGNREKTRAYRLRQREA